MGRVKVTRTVKANTSKRVSTVKTSQTTKANALVEKKLRRGSRDKKTTRRGRGSASTKAVALRVSGPTAQNTGNIVRNTLAATRQRVSTTNLGIKDTNPLD